MKEELYKTLEELRIVEEDLHKVKMIVNQKNPIKIISSGKEIIFIEPQNIEDISTFMEKIIQCQVDDLQAKIKSLLYEIYKEDR